MSSPSSPGQIVVGRQGGYVEHEQEKVAYSMSTSGTIYIPPECLKEGRKEIGQYLVLIIELIMKKLFIGKTIPEDTISYLMSTFTIQAINSFMISFEKRDKSLGLGIPIKLANRFVDRWPIFYRQGLPIKTSINDRVSLSDKENRRLKYTFSWSVDLEGQEYNDSLEISAKRNCYKFITNKPTPIPELFKTFLQTNLGEWDIKGEIELLGYKETDFQLLASKQTYIKELLDTSVIPLRWRTWIEGNPLSIDSIPGNAIMPAASSSSGGPSVRSLFKMKSKKKKQFEPIE